MSSCPPLLQHTFYTLQEGRPVTLSDYFGKVILVANTASECLFTPQYVGLEELYRAYKAQGLIVLGFPSNDFGSQEPGEDGDIADFCKRHYDVSFPMFKKSAVRGESANPFYQALRAKTGSTPHWNFHKYLIHPDGGEVESFSALTFPSSWRLKRYIEHALKMVV